MILNKEYKIEADQMTKKNENNQSFEKAKFYESNIENQIIKVNQDIKNMKTVHDLKDKLLNEAINGVINIFKITNVEEGFKENGMQREHIEKAVNDYEHSRNKEPGIISQLLLVINRRLAFALNTWEIDLIYDSKAINESGMNIHVTDGNIKVTDLKRMLAK